MTISSVGSALRVLQPTIDRLAADGELSRADEKELRAELATAPRSIADRVVKEARVRAATNKRPAAVPPPPSGARDEMLAVAGSWKKRLEDGQAAEAIVVEIAARVAKTPPNERQALATALHRAGLVQQIVTQANQPTSRPIIEMLTADRQRVLLALSHGAPAALFSDALLERNLRTPEELLMAMIAQPELAPRLAERFFASERAVPLMLEAARHDGLPRELTGRPGLEVSPRDRETLVKAEARGIVRWMERTDSRTMDLFFIRNKEAAKDPLWVSELVRLAPRLAARFTPYDDFPEAVIVGMLASSPSLFEYLSDEQRSRPSLQRAALMQSPQLIGIPAVRTALAKELLADVDVLLRLARVDGAFDPIRDSASDWSLLELAPEHLRRDPAFLTKFFTAGGSARGVPVDVWTEGLATIAAFEAGGNLLHVPRHLWTEGVVVAALSHEPAEHVVDSLGEALQTWPPLADRALQRRLIAANALSLRWLDPAWGESRELAAEVVRTQGLALAQFAPEVRSDPALLAKAAASDPRILLQLSLDFGRPEYRAILMQAVERHPRLFDNLAQTEQRFPELLRLAATAMAHPQKAAPAGGSAEDPLPVDAALARKLVATQIGVLARLPPALLKDPQFMVEAVRAFPPILDDLPRGSLPRAALVALAPELEGLARSYRARLDHAGISDPFRFANKETLEAILATRERGPTSSKPRALVLFARDDHNGAFRANQLPELVRHYEVEYVEVGDEHELLTAWAGATDRGAPLDLVVVGAHGARHGAVLGAHDLTRSAKDDERLFIDLSDRDQFRQALAKVRYAPGAKLIVDGCSMGKGRQNALNVANMMRDATGLTTFASVFDSTSSRWIDRAGRVRPEFEGGPFQTYVAERATP
jgi:hypothetical protein